MVPVRMLVRQHQAFAEMNDALQEDRSLAQLLQTAARCAARGCAAPMAKILKLDGSNDVLIVKGQHGMGEEVLGRDAGHAQAGNPPGEALTLARPIVVDDVLRDRGADAPQLFRDFGVVTSVNVPLIGADGRLRRPGG